MIQAGPFVTQFSSGAASAEKAQLQASGSSAKNGARVNTRNSKISVSTSLNNNGAGVAVKNASSPVKMGSTRYSMNPQTCYDQDLQIMVGMSPQTI